MTTAHCPHAAFLLSPSVFLNLPFIIYVRIYVGIRLPFFRIKGLRPLRGEESEEPGKGDPKGETREEACEEFSYMRAETSFLHFGWFLAFLLILMPLLF